MNQKILDKKRDLLKEIKELESTRDRNSNKISTKDSDYRVSLLGRVFMILFGAWHGLTVAATGFLVIGAPVILSLIFGMWGFCGIYLIWWLPAGAYYFTAYDEEKNNNKWMVNSIGLAINKAFIFLFFGDKNTSWEYLTFSSNVDRVKETFSNLNKLKSKVEKEFEKDISEKKLFLAELDTRIREEELKELFDDRLKLGTE